MKVNVTTAGLHKLLTKATAGVHFLGSDGLRQVLQEKGAGLVQTFSENIASFTPGRVPDIKESTKRQKVRDGWSVYPILVASGDMLSSIVSRVRHLKKGGWILSVDFPGIDRTGVRNADKARAHLEGNAHLPRRDFTTIPRVWSANLFKAIRQRMRR